MTAVDYFKVVGPAGESVHGGSLTWSLPTRAPDGAWTPGGWHEVAGPIQCCVNGLHLTSEPINWWCEHSRVFAVEYEGDADRSGDDADKVAVRRCRLVAEESWERFQVVSAGRHVFTAGRVRAYGSATVRASGSATVEASGSATVEASDSATVRASGSATVRAYDSASVRASGSATVIRTRHHARGPVPVLADDAVCVDRTGPRPVCRVADESGAGR